MRARRWPWLLTAGVLLMASAVTAYSTYLHWLPCRGSLLDGSLLQGYRYGSPGFSDACLRRMDGGLPFPYPPEPAELDWTASALGIAALVLVAVAWLALLSTLRWPVLPAAAAALPALATLATAAVATAALNDPLRAPDSYLSLWLWMAPDLAVVAGALAVWRWHPTLAGRDLVRLLVVAWGTTAFSFVHSATEFTVMIALSDANWDVPPLTGYLTAATMALSAVLTVALTLRPTQGRLADQTPEPAGSVVSP